MSQPSQCRKHPAYQALHPPYTVKPCVQCERMWTWACRQRVKKQRKADRKAARLWSCRAPDPDQQPWYLRNHERADSIRRRYNPEPETMVELLGEDPADFDALFEDTDSGVCVIGTPARDA